MELSDVDKKLTELFQKRRVLLESLVAPARAAANQMVDAGMKSGAAPLQEIFFQYDAIEQELHQIVENDPEEAVKALFRRLGHG